jgi:hypothetical protein
MDLESTEPLDSFLDILYVIYSFQFMYLATNK